jgi:hypothetical protein
MVKFFESKSVGYSLAIAAVVLAVVSIVASQQPAYAHDWNTTWKGSGT